MKPRIFIHGTTSAMLAMLPHNQFQLMGPIAATNNKTAPLTGELNAGGLDVARDKSQTAFGIIGGKDSSGRGTYSEGDVFSSYANTSRNYSSNEKLADYLEETIKTKANLSFEYLHLFLIFFLRSQELGINLNVSDAEYQTYIEHVRKSLKLYYLPLILTKFLFPNNNVTKTKTRDEIKEMYHPEKLAAQIFAQGLDLEDIYLNPTEEKLNKLINAIDPSSSSEKMFTTKRINYQIGSIKYGASWKTYKSGFFVDNYRTANISNWINDIIDSGHGYQLSIFSRAINAIKGFFRNIFSKFSTTSEAVHLSSMEKAEYFRRHFTYEKKLKFFQNNILKTIDILNNRVDLLADLIKNPVQKIVDDANIDLVANPFPIVFLYKDSDNLLYRVSREFRSKHPLTLGLDIKYMASDTPENIERLKQYLAKHGLDKAVTVVSFEDIKQYAQNNEEALPRELREGNNSPNYQTINNQSIDVKKHKTIHELKQRQKQLLDDYKAGEKRFGFFAPKNKLKEARQLKTLVKKLETTRDPNWEEIVTRTRIPGK